MISKGVVNLGQLVILLLLIIAGKLISDVFRDKFQKSGTRAAKGEVIDISKAWIDMNEMPFRKRDHLLSEPEITVYKMFKQILSGSPYEIFPKIALGELLLLDPGVAHNPQEYLKRARQKSTDWVICELSSFKPVLVVLSEERPENHNHGLDTFSKQALETAGIPYFSLNPNKPPTLEHLLQELRKLGINI
ncbi:MAG: DUF2726 domain-containing protein [Syntrophomonas sp.]